MLIGLTGGIACGKSTVSKLLAQKGAIIVDADLIARLIVAPGSEGLNQLQVCFGSDILDEHGALDRPSLGKIVFADPEKRVQLEKITHPLIAKESNRQITEALAQNPPLVVYDAALLFESGRADAFRPVVVVYLNREEQVKRVMVRDGISAEDAQKRIDAQMSVEQKVALADFKIDNSGDLESLSKQVDALFDLLHKP
jgi:dephospho-CoA kinase